MSTDIVKFEGFQLAQVNQEMLEAALDANLAGQQMGLGDLDRIKVPSGGGISWEVPTLEGTDIARELEVVVLHHKLARAYWAVDLDESGGGTPPDCQSPDNVWGYGDPGDSLRTENKGCDQCPFAQFGSGKEGRGQACKQMHMLFVCLPGDLLPMALSLPPTSLKAAKSFLWRLSSKARPFYSVTIGISLEKVQGSGTPDYARAVFRVTGTLDPEETARVKAFSDKLKPVFDRVTVDVDPGVRDAEPVGEAEAAGFAERPAAPPAPAPAPPETAGAVGEEDVPLA